MEEKLKGILEMMDAVLEDTTVPRNIKRAVSEAKEKLMGDDELTVKVSAALYLIEPVTVDVNIPPHTRTQVWAIMSALESVKH